MSSIRNRANGLLDEMVKMTVSASRTRVRRLPVFSQTEAAISSWKRPGRAVVYTNKSELIMRCWRVRSVPIDDDASDLSIPRDQESIKIAAHRQLVARRNKVPSLL